MDIASATAMLRRWWGVTLAGLLLIVAGVGYGVTQVPLTYKTQGAMVLIPPPATLAQADQANNPSLVNPMLQFSSSLNITAHVAIRAITDAGSAQLLRQQGATAAYSLSTGNDGVSPLIAVDVKGASPEAVLRTAQVVLKAAQAELVREQVALLVPSSNYVTTYIVTRPDSTSTSWSGRLKFLAEVVGLGAMATLLTATGLDGLARRRRRRLHPEMSPTPAEAAPPASRPIRTTSLTHEPPVESLSNGRTTGS